MGTKRAEIDIYVVLAWRDSRTVLTETSPTYRELLTFTFEK